jgi:uncharacterized circularly permuted ATP-grasp superfamily protein
VTMVDVHNTTGIWDELIAADGTARPAARQLVEQLRGLGLSELLDRQALAELDILSAGITFTVYSDGRGTDRAWPFDIVPRIIEAAEWRRIEAGLVQRLTALNLFIDDIYNDRRVIADGVFPAALLSTSQNYRQLCEGIRPRFGVWAHVCGSDLVRDGDGTMYVLEDNLRVPSGVSYMLENRLLSKRLFADLFTRQSILPVDDYPDQLHRLLCSLAPDHVTATPTVAVLTPGSYNSAYFEHTFLAQRMGVPLVEGSDLFTGPGGYIYMRTISGPERVDVIYRRIDDLYLDPQAFDPTSVVGVRGLIAAWRDGKVAIANAPGAGMADDKVVYAWVPDLIRYYLGTEPLIPNVPTFRCLYADERAHVLDNLDQLVLKPANESGGYGLLIGDQASPEALATARKAIELDPRNWVAQPILKLSTAPTLADGRLSPRHLDLRPFILSGESVHVTAGGLTRVALREGSLVVNSSQGGGSKDTWIVELDETDSTEDQPSV